VQRIALVLLLLTILATFILYWIYAGYGQFLHVLTLLHNKTAVAVVVTPVADRAEEHWPTMTVLLTVHNEEAVIRRRIENILKCDYPAEKLQVLIASDGSTDSTNDIVRSFRGRGVRLFESPGLGKTGTQNAAIRTIESELIAFTDADILFDADWCRQVARHFRNPHVGAVDGRALYEAPQSDALQACQGFYWTYELKLRHLESQLGILAVVAGACFTLRRSLFVPMDPAIGEDCIVPLDVVSQGQLVVHEPLAIARFDSAEDSSITLRRRIRMTLRNWQGTWTRSHLLNPLRHPGYAFALWSHKLLRWLSPLFLATATVCSLAQLIFAPSIISAVLFAPFGGLFALAGIGWLSVRRHRRIPGTGAAYSFLVANIAFLIGIWRAVTGHRIHSYRNA
jgi:cellulose synthase/poly-beta-1,6-N-acetylglucosamine synthase-like glycosyltransferase